jgi:hypothetical protein
VAVVEKGAGEQMKGVNSEALFYRHFQEDPIAPLGLED